MNKKTLFAVIAAAFVALPAAAATEGKDYEVISVEVAPVHRQERLRPSNRPFPTKSSLHSAKPLLRGIMKPLKPTH